jgi:subtilisin-like proprotein convertase family protein
MRQLCSFLLVFGLFSNLFAQNNFWTPISADAIALPEGAERSIQPSRIQTFQLDYARLQASLANAPMEFTAAAKQQPLNITLPLGDGSLHNFQVWESPIMAAELMAKFPGIRTYAGTDTEGLGLTVRMDYGHKGFHAFIFSENGQVQSVRPYANGTEQFYMSYFQKDLKPVGGSEPRHVCGVEDELGNILSTDSQNGPSSSNRGNAERVTLKKYNIAITAQGEYSQHHGGTKPLVMSAIVEALNYLVALQERDWAVRLELIANNDTLIFLDPATDPFSGPLIPNWIGDNPSAINSRVDINSYDIGHLFAKVANPSGIYVAGQASLSGVCTQIQKAVAGSSLPNPDGEDFYLIIAHEMGHQFSATHTFNRCLPSEDATSPGTAYEPGGGSTIMSYATTCDPDIVAERDAYFHVASLEQVANFINVAGGGTCAENILTDNNVPEITLAYSNDLYIPISTPFELTGNVTDENDDELSYCWEQFDLGPSAPLGQPIGNSPSFRSFPPTDSPTRTFPRMASVIGNVSANTEVLPTYGRDLRFKLTVRDNAPGAGGVAIASVRLRSAAAAGPFRITYPNNNVALWNVGEYQTITWNVANTDAAPVNCQKVNLRLSIDGGQTYPIVLAEGLPNIGRACIQVPNNTSTAARVRIDAVDNVFFDISNSNFTIQQPINGNFSMCPAKLEDFACLPADYTTLINTTATASFADSITLSVSGLPAGATATFSPNPVAAGETSTLTIVFPIGSPEALFDLTILGNSGAVEVSQIISLTTVNNDFATFAPLAPLHGATGVNPNPLLQWNPTIDANAYDVQLATNPSFEPGTIVSTSLNTTLNSFQVANSLTEGAVYYWRVRAKNDCGGAVWTEPQAFVVSVFNCVQLSANDVPSNISANGTPTVESKITLPSGGQISDLNITKVQGFHEYFRDLEVRLISPAGTNVLLWKDRCGSFNGPFNISFDDGAAALFSCPPPSNGSQSKSSGLLSTFNGENASGVWTLQVKDNSISSGGTLSAFELEICSNEATNPPLITVNNVLNPVSGTNQAIDASFLKAEDINNTPAQLIFTLVSAPQKGVLESNGYVLQVGGQFSQFDLDNGGVRYFDYGWNQGSDEFRFVVSDGEGGMDTGVFTISPNVSTKDPLSGLSFVLAPNPADDVLRLTLPEALSSDALVSLYNTAGQRIRTWTLATGNTFQTLQIGDLPEGIYAVSIENEAVRGVKKVVIH